MPAVVADWKTSEHALSYDGGSGATTYCASCKSPRQADPAATYPGDPVPPEDWEGVTCGACHPPHDLRVTLFGALAIYTPGADPDLEGSWTDIPELDEDAVEAQALCTNCHSGPRHGITFAQGYPRTMEKKGVTCFDCHMSEREAENPDDGYVSYLSHSWNPLEDVAATCGLNRDACHSNHDEQWAEKELEKGIHGDKKSYGQVKDKDK
jgi:hypothetical protein